MKIIDSPEIIQKKASEFKAQGKQIGFVPTMGYLHEGHEQLIKEAKEENDIVILSIFINPLQFGEGEDLDRYPRDEVHDQTVAQKLGVDLLFFPTKESMYPTESAIQLSVNKRTNVLCGKSRPGHFDGVVTVVAKLFHLCQPAKAYFGMKDAQQVAVVKALVDDLNFPVEIVPVATVREPDGLAKSSRNVNLNDQERKDAPVIYAALQQGREMIRNGEQDLNNVKTAVNTFIETHTHGKIDYVELLSYPELENIDRPKGQMIIAAAVQFEKARLIDNQVFDSHGAVTIG
ncbi:pantothenate synthetase [Thalassobacillus devorans]|uniref:Pantothenate synthetase n=1 Tax=Thalassobacillus devorans TaxID=279813 RepID=A0ABQ1NZV0_9BACI|nr:pantoate--beta-alanine ligase [Thalassobacillus devorans]NIK28281.1 pantoate--beta-alanine ligase [Thalassobacillus devorans]GGC87481.1 pantothenate synthetase [Thalassobacillus devorans]